MEGITQELFSMQDLTYRDFQSRLMPTVDKEKIIGVRTPQLRRFADSLAKTEQAKVFMDSLPHKYYEEDNVHGFLIEKLGDYGECIRALEQFLPYIDNWATCDMISPKVLKKQPQKLITEIEKWLSSEKTYVVRFGIGCLMKYYLDEHFSAEYAAMVSAVHSDEYYIKMMQAWYFATALAKQYEAILPYLSEQRLEVWVHNKTIQKAVESHRITPEQKIHLKNLRIK